MNTMSHVTTTLSSGNPHKTQRAPTTTIDDWLRGSTTMIKERRQPPTNVHGRPTPPLTNSDDGPLATRTHHHDRQVPMNSHEGPPPSLTNGHEGRPEQRETCKVCGRTSLHFDPPWLTLPSMLRSMAITRKPTSDEDHPLQPPTNNDHPP